MAIDDGDGGVHESVGTSMRAAAVLAMQVGERLAKTWADLARDAQQRATTESRVLAARIESERAAAVAGLAVLDRPEWWAAANEQQVAQVLEIAATWRGQDPIAARAMSIVDREVGDRYGLSLEAVQQRARAGQGREAVEAMTAADILDRAAADHKTRGDRAEDSSSGETKEAAAALQLEQQPAAGAAAAADAEQDAGDVAYDVAYDSAERRAALAASLERGSEPDVVAGRVRMDVNFAYPAEQAARVRGTGSVTRGRPGATPDRSRHRPGRTR